MAHNNRHIHVTPDGDLHITIVTCEDGAPNEESLCKKAAFELYRPWMPSPMTAPGQAEVARLGSLGLDWRYNIHYTDWIGCGESDAPSCAIVRASDLPTDKTLRDRWVLNGGKVIIN